MKATIHGQTYFASWRHITREGLGKNAGKTYEETTCIIRVLKSDNTIGPYSEGTARQNFIDAPNRPYANHLTLAKALGITHYSDVDSLAYKLYRDFAGQIRPTDEGYIIPYPKEVGFLDSIKNLFRTRQTV